MNVQAITASPVTVDFHGTAIPTFNVGGIIRVAMRPICDGIGLQWESQYNRIKRHPVLSATIFMMNMVAGDGRRRKLVTLPLNKLNGWLFGVDTSRVNPDIRKRLVAYQAECFDVLSDYWQKGEAVNAHTSSVADTTIGTDGFHVLSALISGKVRSLPQASRRQASTKLWSQVHTAFNVQRGEDIPADQLDAARTFVAAYSIEGDWLPAPVAEPPKGTVLTDEQLHNFWVVCHHVADVLEIYRRYNLYDHLTGLGSRAAIEMNDHLVEGAMLGRFLTKRLEGDIRAARHRLRIPERHSVVV